MKLRIGNYQAAQLRNRINSLNITQKQLAEHLSLSERYIREILSTSKSKDITVDSEKMEALLALLGISYAHLFLAHTPTAIEAHPLIDEYTRRLKSRMYNLLSKESDEEDHNKQLAQYLQEDKAVNKTMGFWYTLIVKTIADRYKVMRHFFNENDFFSIVPKQGYWRRFQHDPKQQKNCYFSFKIKPSKANCTFKIAYTLESPIAINSIIPRKIKIIFGKIEQRPDYTLVTQFHDTPASYKIKASDELIITTWLDEAKHDFIVLCEDDFQIETSGFSSTHNYSLGVNTKRQVHDLFLNLETALFPRNHLFHRSGKNDMGDDPIFFWNNQNFLKLNANLLESLLDDVTK